MDFFALLVTAVGLSMDAFSVALCKGLSLKEVRAKEGVITGLYFGGFQAFMPIIGYFFRLCLLFQNPSLGPLDCFWSIGFFGSQYDCRIL